MEESYAIEWVAEPDGVSVNEQDPDDDNITEEEYLVGDEIIPSSEINSIPNSLDQIAAENLILMAHEGNVSIMGDLIEEQVEQAENADYNGEYQYECQVQEEVITEEVITDDWVQQQGEDRVEVPVYQIGSEACVGGEEVDVPLPTNQDEYTTSRPYPCDFCSRRFRKKANLMNHMVAHKNDRPHICNLCGARYIRRVDLLTHLKVHAQVPEQELEDIKPVIFNEMPTRATRKPAKTAKQSRAAKAKRAVATTRNNEYTSMDPAGANMKTEYIQQEDMQLLIEAAQQHEQHEQYAVNPMHQQQQQQHQQSMHEEVEPEPHVYEVTDPDRPFVCQKCGVSFAREKALLSHSRMHGTDSPLECDSCSDMFWDVAQLREHQKIHHAGQSSNSEYEPDADQAPDSDSDADSKYGVFYCSTCGLSFHRNELLVRHQKTHIKYDKEQDVNTTIAHDGGHSCNVCGNTFAEALDLLAHAEVHTRYQPFKCMLCGETFLEESVIKRHISNVHADELSENSCGLCGKLCRDSRTLMKHSWEHSSEKNHSCSKCGKTFHNKARLKRHMQSHRNKSVTCDVCSAEFPDGRSLMNHRHSHTNVSGRQFPCKECGKTFGSRSSQQIHMRIHTGERPYGCRFCWKAFADGGTLRKHERIHTGEKPYACPVCPRAFNQRVVLREHIRSHHSGPDNKLGSSASPYYCSVCGETYSTSMLLIQHLIEHSDMNTAMKRQPPTGPRKYKRRRKLKPHELENRTRNVKKTAASDYTDEEVQTHGSGKHANDPLDEFDNHQPNTGANGLIEEDDEDDDGLNDEYTPPEIKQTRRGADHDRPRREKKKSFSALDDNYTALNNVENTLQNIDSLVIPSGSSAHTNNHMTGGSMYGSGGGNSSIALAPQPAAPTKTTAKQTAAAKKRAASSKQPETSRPKMIHTQKMRVPVEDNGSNKRRTKTMITRTTAGTMATADEPPTRPSTRAAPTTRARRGASAVMQQNVTINHQTRSISIKEEDLLSRPLSETEILLKLSRKNPKFSPDVVNDLEEILRSPIKSRLSQDEYGLSSGSHATNLNPSTSTGGAASANTFITLSPARDHHSSSMATGSSSYYMSPATKRLVLDDTGQQHHHQEDETESGTEPDLGQLHHHGDDDDDDEDDDQEDGRSDEDLHQEDAYSDGELRFAMRIKQEQDEDFDMPDEQPSDGFTCEMCSAVFRDRSQLLLHVPIHI